MILRDGDTLYPLYDMQWPTYYGDTLGASIETYKYDCDNDGDHEYVLFKTLPDREETGYLGMTILEIEESTLRRIPLTLSDVQQHTKRISFKYSASKEEVTIYVDSKDQGVLDVAWVNKLYEQDKTTLTTPRAYVKHQDGQFYFDMASAFSAPEGETQTFIAASFEAPLTYTADGTFEVKGFLFVYQILFLVIRLVVDKECRRMYNKYKK